MSKNGMEMTLAQWLIKKTDGEAYRAGHLNGWRHPKVDKSLLASVGGLQKLLEQAKSLEQDPMFGKTGKVIIDWRDMGRDIRKIDYDVSIIPELCRREGFTDPREKQMKVIACVEYWRAQVTDVPWILPYYDDLLERLKNGKEVSEAEEELRFKCLNAVVKQKEFIWERVFSARVFNDSKKFNGENGNYKQRIFSILKNYSPYYEDEMSKDELFAMHDIHSYAQTLEWKGPLQYVLDREVLVDTSVNRYGTVLNTQTMEHAVPYSLCGCKKIMTIENKANYENMRYESDALYIFCHGFFAPKEVKFLKEIVKIASPECEFYHWGDMDYGGIRIFQFIKENLFAKLLPYRMDITEFRKAIEAGGGIKLEADTREKLLAKDAGMLTELKEIILQTNMTIEQERIL